MAPYKMPFEGCAFYRLCLSGIHDPKICTALTKKRGTLRGVYARLRPRQNTREPPCSARLLLQCSTNQLQQVRFRRMRRIVTRLARSERDSTRCWASAST